MAEFHAAFQTGRSGDEPMHARSPLRLRLGLAGFGLASAIAGIVLFAVVNVPALVGVFAALAALTVVDAAIVLRHIRAGADYQPGREVPPYRPPRRTRISSAPEHPEAGPERRHARFFWAAAVALVLIINAWTWVSSVSTGAAAVLSIVAALLLPLGVITANAGSPTLHGNSVPESDVDAATESEQEPESEPEPLTESDSESESEHEPGARRTHHDTVSHHR
jgi:Family of unknown function (DUF6343)